MSDLWMDVDAALTEVPINKVQLIDDGDFKTREESVVYNQAGLDLVWEFVTTAGVTTFTAVTPTDTGGDYDFINQGDAFYTIEIPASGGASINNDTEGFGRFIGFATGILPWIGEWIGFRAAALNNALIDGGDVLDVNLIELVGDAQSAADMKDFADDGYDPSTNKVQGVLLTDTASTVTDGAKASIATEARLAELDAAKMPADLDTIKSSTGGLAGAAMRGTDGANTTTPDNAGIADIQSRIPDALVSGNIKSDILAISGDNVAADNLESQYDTTGLAGDTFPATQAQVGNIAVAGSAVNVPAESYVLTTGNLTGGTVADTAPLDNVYQIHTDAAGAMDLYYQFDVTADGTPSSVTVTGYLNGGNDSLEIYAYNWAGASWDQIGIWTGSGAATNTVNPFDLYTSHVGTGANLGKVRIRFTDGAFVLTTATLGIDQIFVSYSAIPISLQTKGAVSDATPTTIGFDTDLTQADDFWEDAILTFTSGALSGQSKTITTYVNANGAVTFDEPLTSIPADTDNFIIQHTHVHPVTQIADAVLAGGDIDGFSLEESQKLLLAALSVLAGGATTTNTFEAADGSKIRITATVDADGNRSVVVFDATG